MGVTYGNPPYHESSLKAALRLALANGGLSAGLGGGLSAVPRGANFGTAFLASLGGSSRAYSAAQQAAQEYAMKQQQAKEESDFRDYQKLHLAAQTKALEKPPPEPKIPGKQQDYEHLISLGMSADQARQIVYGTTLKEQISTKSAERPPKTEEDTSWMSGLIRTTRGGKQFFDASELQGKEKAAAMKWATQKGLSVAGSNEIGQLQDVDTARGNIEDIRGYVKSILPVDAQGRATEYPGIRLSALLQTNEKRAAFGAYRAAAIRNLRAMAGSKGLRINQAEINLAIKNDIPNITDTYGTASRKMDIVSQMLDNAESPILNRNWGKGGIPDGGKQVGDPLGIR